MGGGDGRESPQSPPPLLLCLQNMEEMQIQLFICLIIRIERKKKKKLTMEKNELV